MKKKLSTAAAVSWLILILAILIWPLLLVLGIVATTAATGATVNWITAILIGVVLNGIYLRSCYKDALVILARREAAEHND